MYGNGTKMLITDCVDLVLVADGAKVVHSPLQFPLVLLGKLAAAPGLDVDSVQPPLHLVVATHDHQLPVVDEAGRVPPVCCQRA